ncbi:rRNA methyltransferase [Schizosaccharomyces cryophilus OY26]|uniref:rRNA methyltransferase n=1 Tax=Schizosaccharomyces cryophilus (strain OY26 / ATCC MYA-4695 / CBS 11777 / NBRC 106824 / NRRL Y48691) TaxID=653667 RepID=S9XE51_SCHCR|nr:rRNA methyltransferase [Schizosaccharomyces cryophilus OY26]EPY52056.1 rRNA methyltransferase [Schizosaccharomyces cryophilus OY26]
MSRPEHIAPPEIFYNDEEAGKYNTNTRIQSIQAEMTERAIELLDPEGPSLLLDIGSGSGISSSIAESFGHVAVGMDISPSMLSVALESQDVEGDMLLADMGNGVPFRAGTFDGVISISAIQWLLNADKTCNVPQRRLNRFFETLYSSMKRGGRAVMQYYPESDRSQQMILDTAKKCGFAGGIVVDHPESKRQKKFYLILQAGGMRALNTSEMSVEDEKVDAKKRKSKRKHEMNTREYIEHKKDLNRKRGRLSVPKDSKYSGRRRKVAF